MLGNFPLAGLCPHSHPFFPASVPDSFTAIDVVHCRSKLGEKRGDSAMKWGAGVLAFLVLLAGIAYGQTVGASIQGSITDATGAVLPGASIAVKNVGTG